MNLTKFCVHVNSQDTNLSEQIPEMEAVEFIAKALDWFQLVLGRVSILIMSGLEANASVSFCFSICRSFFAAGACWFEKQLSYTLALTGGHAHRLTETLKDQI